MAWGGGKEDSKALVEAYQGQIDILKQRVTELEKDRNKLLDALLSVKAPEAYAEMKHDEYRSQSTSPNIKEEEDKKAIIRKTEREWLRSLEGPLFTSPDDFDQWLRTRTGPPDPEGLESEPLHPGNPES